MTVAVAVKVFDGVVLAADSATTLFLPGTQQVYNHANKIFHLHRTKPIGAMTWGLGQLAGASIATLAKDFRRRLMGRDPDHLDWELSDDYTVEEVAGRLVEMMFDELYSPLYLPSEGQEAPVPPPLGLAVAGYSAGASQAEVREVIISHPTVRPEAALVVPQENSGWLAYGQPEATRRLFLGFDPPLLSHVLAIVPEDVRPQVNEAFLGQIRQPVQAAMPFQDAINLAEFLVEVTVGFARYNLGPDTVGGPIRGRRDHPARGFSMGREEALLPKRAEPREPT